MGGPHFQACGIVLPGTTHDQLLAPNLLESHSEGEAMGGNGRQYVIEKLFQHAIAEGLVKTLQ
jgi:hypothetical protein